MLYETATMIGNVVVVIGTDLILSIAVGVVGAQEKNEKAISSKKIMNRRGR